MFSMRSKDKRVVLIAAVLSVFVLMALKWEWDIITRTRQQQPAQQADAQPGKPQQPAQAPGTKRGKDGETAWGWPLQGDPAFWNMVNLECKKDTGKMYTMADLEANAGEKEGDKSYILLRGYVLDITAFRPDHPGGEAIAAGIRRDASVDFENAHQPFVGSMLSNFCIGKMYPSGVGHDKMHPSIYRLRMFMRPGENKFLWKRSYYWNTAWRKFKHSYFGMDTIPHVYYLVLPVVYSAYMIFSDLFYHPDIDSSWMLIEPFKTFFDNQGAYRQDFYQEGQTYRLYDHSILAFGMKGKHRAALEAGIDVNCPTSPMYGRRVLRSDEIVPFEAE